MVKAFYNFIINNKYGMANGLVTILLKKLHELLRYFFFLNLYFILFIESNTI
jgi:hypothetical protein